MERESERIALQQYPKRMIMHNDFFSVLSILRDELTSMHYLEFKQESKIFKSGFVIYKMILYVYY